MIRSRIIKKGKLMNFDKENKVVLDRINIGVIDLTEIARETIKCYETIEGFDKMDSIFCGILYGGY